MIALAKKRLLHVVGYADRGGCETCCAAFIQQARDFEHTVLVLGPAGPMSGAWLAQGATVVHLDVLDSGWWSFRARLSAELCDRVFAGAIVWTGIRIPLVQAALAQSRCPVILHAGNPFAARWRVRLLFAMGGRFLPRPRALTVIACSEHVAASYERAPYFRRLRVEACLNPVETPLENPHRCRDLVRGEPVRLGMVARLDGIKDHRTLIHAVKLLRSRWPRVELHLAGDGPLRGALAESVQELDLTNTVRFHGSIADVPAFLGQLDVFCFITTLREGMGNALAEAMAHGLPCVVNDLPVMREVAGSPADGAVRVVAAGPAQIGGAIGELLENADERRRLSAAAWRRAREVFAPRRVVNRYLEILKVHA